MGRLAEPMQLYRLGLQKSYYVLARVQPSLERKHAVPREGLAARYPLPHCLRPRLLLSQRVSWTIGAQGRRHHCWLWRKTRPGKSSINIWWGWDLILPLHRLLRPWNFLKQNLGFSLSRWIFSCSIRTPTLHRDITLFRENTYIRIWATLIYLISCL